MKEEKNIVKTISSIKNKTKNVFLMPSDKTKRLIALDSDYYHDILKSSLCKDDVKLRNTLPTTRQQSFNAKLKEISDKYKDTPAGIKLSFCKCSEPLPSTPYALPKDHKSNI